MSPEQDARRSDPTQVLSEAQDELSRELARILRGTRIMFVVGIVLAAVIAVYLHWILGELGSMIAEPDTMAIAVRQQVEKQIPEVMTELEKSLSENAPGMVADARATLIQRLPEINREGQARLSAYIAEQVAGKLGAELDKMIQDIIRDNKKEMDALIDKSLEEGGAAKLKAEFEKLFADAIGESLDAALEETNARLTHHRDHLRHLRTAEKLTPWEEEEKELVTAWVILIANTLEETAARPGMEEPKAAM